MRTFLTVVSVTVMLAAAGAASASPDVDIDLPDYCHYYDVEMPALAVDGMDNGTIIEIEDIFNGRDYYGCAVNAGKYPNYRGWVGHVQHNSYMCGSVGSALLPEHPDFADDYLTACPAIYGFVPAWRWTPNGWDRTTVGETDMSPFELDNRVYVHPYGTHAGWRWVYKSGEWYAVQTKWVNLAWLVKL